MGSIVIQLPCLEIRNIPLLQDCSLYLIVWLKSYPANIITVYLYSGDRGSNEDL